MLAPWIIESLPPHRIYVEPFAGAGSVLMRKKPAPFCEVVNDLDGEIVNLYRVLRNQAQAESLCRMLELTPFARAEFALSYEPVDGDPIEQARRTVVRAFQGFGSDSGSGAKTGFRANGNRQNTHPCKDWIIYPRCLQAFTERLVGVIIENRPAVDIIRQHDATTTLFYCDPPYVVETRSTNVTSCSDKGYRHEMTDDEHRELAGVLRSAKGMVVVSGYASALYDKELFPDWHRKERKTMADHSRERIEVLWLNEAACAGQGQQHLNFCG